MSVYIFYRKPHNKTEHGFFSLMLQHEHKLYIRNVLTHIWCITYQIHVFTDFISGFITQYNALFIVQLSPLVKYRIINIGR